MWFGVISLHPLLETTRRKFTIKMGEYKENHSNPKPNALIHPNLIHTQKIIEYKREK